MPNTITTYFTFSPKTPARSTEVNNNFSNYRGSLLPINENTISASNVTHNLGATDHFWKTTYTDDIYIGGSVGGWQLSQDTSTSEIKFQSTATTTAYAEMRLAGCPPLAAGRFKDGTTTAEIGGVARSGVFTFDGSADGTISGSQLLTDSKVTLATTGRPVLLFLTPADDGFSITTAFIRFNGAGARTRFARDTVTGYFGGALGLPAVGDGTYSNIMGIDFPGATTSVDYYIYAYSSDDLDIFECELIAFEL